MGKKIHEYTVTAATIEAGSFFDIDQEITPGVYQSQKVPISVMQTVFGSIYTVDGTLTADRTLDGNSFNQVLTLTDLKTFNLLAGAVNLESTLDMEIITGVAGALILPSDTDPDTNVVTPTEFMIKGDSTDNDLRAYIGGGWLSLTKQDGIYDGSGTVPTTTIATVTDSLEFDGGQVGIKNAATINAAAQAATVDFNTGNNQAIDLEGGGGDVTVTLNNPKAGYWYTIKIIQGSTPYNMIWPASVKWGAGQPYTPSVGNDAVDILTMYYDGTQYNANYETNYA